MRFQSAVLSVILLLASGLTWAVPSSAASGAHLGNVQISLVDMAPGDGVDASYSWLPGQPWTRHAVAIDRESFATQAQGWMRETAISWNNGKGDTASSLSDGTLNAQASVASADHRGYASAHLFTGLPGPGSDGVHDVRLSPYTRITVTADGSAWTTQSWSMPGLPQASFARVFLFAGLYGDETTDDGDWILVHGPRNGEVLRDSRQLKATFFNNSASYVDIQVHASALATAYLPLSSGVPEPSTWALIGLGACGLAWRGRRATQLKGAA